jgi:hypothetical protein
VPSDVIWSLASGGFWVPSLVKLFVEVNVCLYEPSERGKWRPSDRDAENGTPVVFKPCVVADTCLGNVSCISINLLADAIGRDVFHRLCDELVQVQ